MAVDDCTTEFFIDGAWTKTVGSIQLDHRVRKNPGVRIQRGTSDQQSTATSDSSEFEVNNGDGIFSNRNPNSALFEKMPRYTKVRHYIPTVGGTLDSYVRFFRPDNTGYLSTADKAGIEIGGDIDIRLELTPDTWVPIGSQVWAGRYAISLGAQRSWLIWQNDTQEIAFRWSTNGTATATAFFSYPSGLAGRTALRFTLDVDNGSGQNVASLYTSSSISGAWTLAQSVTQAGTTSIYTGGTSPIELGNVDIGSPIAGGTQYFGKIHAFELRNGINGTLVANMSAASRDIGTTSWSDGLGNTWSITGTARIGSDRIRHTGEIDTYNYRWDTTRRDSWLPMKSQGALNRMQEAGAPLRSAIYRWMIQYPDPVGYWPLEVNKNSAAGTTYAYLTDCSASNSVPDWLPGSAGALRLNSSTSKFTLGAAGRTSSGENSVLFCFTLDNLPASDKTLVTIVSNGTIRRWEIIIGPGGLRWTGYNSADAVVVNEVTGFGTGANPNGGGVIAQLTLKQEGANVRWTTRWAGVGRSGFYTTSVGGLTYPGTVGRMGQFIVDASADSAFSGAEFAHVMFSLESITVNTADGALGNAANGWKTERAGARALRVTEEEGQEFEIYGDPDDTQVMGVQPIDNTAAILAECARVDGGLFFDLRDKFGVGMRTRVDMENKVYSGFEVPYGNSLLSRVPDPVEDGRFTKNDMTISRPGGGSARFILKDGPLSRNEPPFGIGYRAGSESVNAYSDDQLVPLAEYAVWIRTRDELRIPSLTFELKRTQLEVLYPSIYERAIAANIGDWINVTGLPAFVDYELNKRLIAMGYTEMFNGHLWTIDFNTVTAEGFRAPIASYILIADDEVTELKTAITSSATSMVIRTPVAYMRWADSTNYPGDFPLNAYVDGELVRMTALSTPTVVSGYNEQTATIDRSVNGIVKAQSAGASITVQVPYHLALEN